MVPESVLWKQNTLLCYSALPWWLEWIYPLIYYLLPCSWICWSWASLTLGPPNVESVHLPTWPAVGASWLCSLFSGPGRTQSTASLKPASQAPTNQPEISENFQSWPALLDICVPELGTHKPHSNPTGPTLTIRWSSYFPSSAFWYFCMFRVGQL